MKIVKSLANFLGVTRLIEDGFERLGILENNLSGITERLGVIESKLSGIESNLSGITSSLSSNLGALEKALARIESNLSSNTEEIEGIGAKTETYRATLLDLLGATTIMINLQHEQAAVLQRLESLSRQERK